MKHYINTTITFSFLLTLFIFCDLKNSYSMQNAQSNFEGTWKIDPTSAACGSTIFEVPENEGHNIQCTITISRDQITIDEGKGEINSGLNFSSSATHIIAQNPEDASNRPYLNLLYQWFGSKLAIEIPDSIDACREIGYEGPGYYLFNRI